MITAYNPLVNPQPTNSSTQPEKVPAQAGQYSAANSNFFASVITQLLMQMELQSAAGSGMDNIDSSFMGGNQSVPPDGTATGSQPSNPFDMTQLTGTTFSALPFNYSDLFSSVGFNPNNNQITSANPQSIPLQANNSLTAQSLDSYKTMGADNTVPPAKGNGSLMFHPIDPNQLNGVLGGKLKGMGQAFVQAGQQFNVDPALLASIAQHETGNGNSPAAYTKNNIAGMMGTGGLKSYTSVGESITDMARNISKYYLGSGLTSISQIGAKYAPVGAGNDPTGLNNYWVSGVTRYYNQLRTQPGGSGPFSATV